MSYESLYKLLLDYVPANGVRIYRTRGGCVHFLHPGHPKVQAEVARPR